MNPHKEVAYNIAIGVLMGILGGMLGYWFMVSSILIKANGASGIYHLPHCRSYEATEIGNDTGDRYYLTEASAQAVGFQKAKNCP